VPVFVSAKTSSSRLPGGTWDLSSLTQNSVRPAAFRSHQRSPAFRVAGRESDWACLRINSSRAFLVKGINGSLGGPSVAQPPSSKAAQNKTTALRRLGQPTGRLCFSITVLRIDALRYAKA
jgi:hypothetical protein